MEDTKYVVNRLTDKYQALTVKISYLKKGKSAIFIHKYLAD